MLYSSASRTVLGNQIAAPAAGTVHEMQMMLNGIEKSGQPSGTASPGPNLAQSLRGPRTQLRCLAEAYITGTNLLGRRQSPAARAR